MCWKGDWQSRTESENEGLEWGGGVLKNFGEGSDLTLFILQKDHSGGSAGLES